MSDGYVSIDAAEWMAPKDSTLIVSCTCSRSSGHLAQFSSGWLVFLCEGTEGTLGLTKSTTITVTSYGFRDGVVVVVVGMGDLAADHPAWWRWAYLGL